MYFKITEHVQDMDKVKELSTNRVLMRKLTSVIAGAVKFGKISVCVELLTYFCPIIIGLIL